MTREAKMMTACSTKPASASSRQAGSPHTAPTAWPSAAPTVPCAGIDRQEHGRYATQHRRGHDALSQRGGRDHPDHRARAEEKERQRGERCDRNDERGRHHARGNHSHRRPDLDGASKRQPRHHARGQQRAHHHPRAIHGQREAHRLRAEPEHPHRIRHIPGLQHEPRDVEDRAGDRHRPQQLVLPNEAGTVPDLEQGMALRRGRARRLGQPKQQGDGSDRQHGRQHESRRSAGPGNQRAGKRRAGGERRAACKLQPSIGQCQRLTRHERRHQRRCGNAEVHGADCAQKPEHCQPPDAQLRRKHHGKEHEQRYRLQPLGPHHQPLARHAIGQQSQRHRDQQEGQGLNSCEKANLTRSRTEHQHGDQRHGRKTQLLGRLRREVGPREIQEGTGKGCRHGMRFVRKTSSCDRAPLGAGRFRTCEHPRHRGDFDFVPVAMAAITKSMKVRTFAAGKWRDGYSA